MGCVSLSAPKCFVRCSLVSGSTSGGALGVWQGQEKCLRLGPSQASIPAGCSHSSFSLCVPMDVKMYVHLYVMYSPCLINALCHSGPLLFQHEEGNLPRAEPRMGRGQPWPWGSHWAPCTSSIQTCLPSLPSSQILHFQINILTKGNCVGC